MTRAAHNPTEVPAATDPLHLIDVDHVRCYVGNAKQAAFFYAHAFGFTVQQYRDLTTGSRDEASYLLTQGNIRLMLTTGLNARTTPLATSEPLRRRREGHRLHRARRDQGLRAGPPQRRGAGPRADGAERPDGYGDARRHQDLRAMRSHLRLAPRRLRPPQGQDRRHVHARNSPRSQNFDPTTTTARIPAASSASTTCVGNVGLGGMNQWVQWYSDVLGFCLFKHFDDKDISPSTPPSCPR
jgi:4-hydroxyphenylpyruvate dioxygenase